MKVYLVGGAVRDELLGLTPKDLDYVVVGSTPEEMLELGFTQVGAQFPVFLHPDTGDEYALARTEAKDGNGYHGFNCHFGPEVSLIEDLLRRDLTINAIAKDLETGEIIDPYSGRLDIDKRVLRPVSKSFRDDPVRVLRVARFAARYPSFSVSPELYSMIQYMTKDGSLEYLTPERVWQELEKALGERAPCRFFEVLKGTGVFPELDAFIDVQEHNKWHSEYDVWTHVMLGVQYASDHGFDKVTTFGVLCHDLGKPEAYRRTDGAKSYMHEDIGAHIADSLCSRLKAPTEFSRMAVKAAKNHTKVHLAYEMNTKTIHKFFKEMGDKKSMYRLLDIAYADKRGRGAPACNWEYDAPEYLRECYEAMESTDTKSISRDMVAAGKKGILIGEAIRRAEILSISKVKEKYNV